MDINELIEELSLKQGMNLIVHSSLRQIKKSIPSLNPEDLIGALKVQISQNGSLIMPTFTYCFQRVDGNNEVFDAVNSKSKVGALTEIFRRQNDTIRTSSPTHSFALWGNVVNYFDINNSPASPLGKESIMEWLANNDDSYVLLLGCNFNAMTFGHYLEIINEVPWTNISPWDHLGVLPIGISKKAEYPLTQVPGCSKSFINFQQYLLDKSIISIKTIGLMEFSLISISDLLIHGQEYFKNYRDMLICSIGCCHPCDERRLKLKSKLN